jgi:hypothetical protein
MQTTYYEDDDILVLKLSDKPIAREISQDWNINVSYDAEGGIVEVVVLEARAAGLYPIHTDRPRAA